MDELLEQFLIEGRDLVAQAHAGLIALARQMDDRAALDELFRATHTLKGSVALFDMAPAERLLHAAETYLDEARRNAASLNLRALDTLVAAIDQTDRWIDAMADRGALDGDASGTADEIIEQILGARQDSRGRPGGVTAPRSPGEGRGADWLGPLQARPEFAGLDMAGGYTAFRYRPDAECFFRGEDPLAIVAAVPELVAIAVLPAAGEWPGLGHCEPFRCFAIIEGVSKADSDAVRAAFRLLPDLVEIACLGAPVPATGERDATASVSTLRVEAGQLDALANQSGELGTAVRALGPLAGRVRALEPQLAADLRAVQDQIERAAGTLQRAIARIRLVSLEPALRRLPRLARETSAALGRQVRFQMAGETTRVDKQIVDQLFEPLLHLVRNAIDHGVEPPAERRAVGKPEQGDISLAVGIDGETAVITLADDGRGIDPGVIREAAIGRHLIARQAADALDDRGAVNLVFLPGFSTAATVTGVSGRGVGMDAVKASVERLGGAIAIESAIGAGTRVTIRVPIHAISTPLLLVWAGGEQLGIRLDQILETTRVAASEIQPIGQGRACVLRDATVPVVDLAGLLGLGETHGEHARLVVTQAASGRVAVRVDRLGERIDAVMRDRAALLDGMSHIAGTAQRDDGDVVLVLDLAELVG